MCWYLLTAAAVDVVVVVATANWQHNAARLSYAAYELCMQQAEPQTKQATCVCVCVCLSVRLSVCVCLCSNYIYKKGEVEANGGKQTGADNNCDFGCGRNA